MALTSKHFQTGSLGTAERYPQSNYQVICVCGGHGFPLSAGAARMINIGKALQAGGIGFRLLHCGPSAIPLNTHRSGVYQGISFQYTTCAKRPQNFVARLFVYLWAIAELTLRLLRLRLSCARAAIYLYIMDGPLYLYVACVCRLLGFPIVQEMCEWFPSFRRSLFSDWLYRKPIFAMATGILVISRLIDRRVRERSALANPDLQVYWLPSLVDSQRFIQASPLEDNGTETVPNFLWCGIGYTEDILFLVRALAIVNCEGYRCKLRVLSAAFVTWGPDMIRDYARDRGLPPDAVHLMGCVDDRTLESCYKSATALLLPLWDDDRSRTRMPNKLAEYLASGRPVIASGVGDLLEFLVDGVNAYVSKPGDERNFADKMMAVLRDPSRATQIGAQGQRTCIERLDYRSQVEGLAGYFINCIEGRQQVRSSQDAGEDIRRPAGAHASHCKAASSEGV
jgi:glycosyltransferase involved in cell wall biosynthesis